MDRDNRTKAERRKAARMSNPGGGGSGGGGGVAKPARPPTAFEARLYAVCKCIPAGRVTTYGAMAEVRLLQRRHLPLAACRS